MSGGHLARIEALFGAASQLPPERWEEYLDRAGEEPELRAAALRLLAADREAGDFIETAVAAGTACFARGRRQVIGPYRVVRELGRGGMSAVYLAERDGDFQQRVAIKLVRPGMDSHELLARFRAERQILASIDHPYVARLYDGGTTSDGVPYFVMEPIDGLPIDQFCDRHRLDLAQRIELFRKVCSALHHAHRNLVVHRDLKPSNLLVTAEGVPKLLDFGIAKLLDPSAGGAHPETTATALRLLTPSYASPEQVRGGAVGTASDVYSLGVLLYELLTGFKPLRFDGELSARRLEEIICGEEPERPSEALLRAAPELAAAAARARGCSVGELARRLRGDLDTVVLMAMRKEPERRYGSVEQLSEDLGRHLAGRPVIARPDTLGYRAAKFVRRHRWGVGGAVLLALLLLAFAGVTAVQSARIARERDRAAQVSRMLVELFEVADPSSNRGETITARELVDRGAEKVSALPAEPETAVLLDTLARLYQELGLDARAVPLYERALGIRAERFGALHAEVAAGLNRLARAHAARGDFAAAEPLFRRAYETNRQLHGEEHGETSLTLNNLALVNHDLGHFAEAERLYRQALAVDRKVLGADDPGAAITASNLALLLHDLGDDAGAEALYRQVLATYEAHLEPGDPQIAFGLDDLAMVLLAQGELTEAEPLMRRAFALREARYGERHREVAVSLDHLAQLLLARGELEAAAALAQRALELRRELLGDGHLELVGSLETAAAVAAAGGRFDEADAVYARAIGVYEAAGMLGHPLLARVLAARAALLARHARCPEAVALYDRALAIRRATLPAGNRLIAETAAARRVCAPPADGG